MAAQGQKKSQTVARVLVTWIGATLLGVVGALAAELGASLMSSGPQQPVVSKCFLTTASATPPGPTAGSQIAVCVETPSPSPVSDLLKAVVPTLLGGALGVALFVAGERRVTTKEQHKGEAAVTALINELLLNRKRTIEAGIRPPAGPGPVKANPIKPNIELWPDVRVQVAEAVDSDLWSETIELYADLKLLEGKDLRDLLDPERDRLMKRLEDLEKKLKPFGRSAD